MGLTIKIEADKDDFIGYLEERAGEFRDMARNASAKDVKAKHGGVAEGLIMAARYVANWTVTPDGGPDPAALGRADGRVHDDGPGPHSEYMTP